jgi:hypothetical protein
VELNPQVKKIALHALKQAIKDITGEGSDERLVAPTCFVMLYQFAPRYGNMSLPNHLFIMPLLQRGGGSWR